MGDATSMVSVCISTSQVTDEATTARPNANISCRPNIYNLLYYARKAPHKVNLRGALKIERLWDNIVWVIWLLEEFQVYFVGLIVD